MWLSLTIVNQVPFMANMYAEGNKFYSILLWRNFGLKNTNGMRSFQKTY